MKAKHGTSGGVEMKKNKSELIQELRGNISICQIAIQDALENQRDIEAVEMLLDTIESAMYCAYLCGRFDGVKDSFSKSISNDLEEIKNGN